MEYKKECEWCGVKFVTNQKLAKYCCAEHKSMMTQKRYTDRRALFPKEPVAKTVNKENKELVNMAVEARKAGMTYGQYVAQLYLKKGARA